MQYKMALLEVQNIYLRSNKGVILQEIEFEQQQFEKIAIAGETGSGKTSLLKIIAGLVQASEGIVRFKGNIVKGPDEKLIPGHSGIAYLSQYFELPGYLRVEQVLDYVNTLSDEETYKLYKICHIEHLLERRTDKLSGGEKQRIALARLLLTSPQLLLLDEPYSNLDRVHKATLQQVVKDIGQQLGITIAMVSHDPADTLSWADRILIIQDGKLVQQGAPITLYHQPVNAYVAGLLGQYQLLDKQVVQKMIDLPNTIQENKRLLVRPEYFSVSVVSNVHPTGVLGIISQILFFGSYYEVRVLLFDDSELLVKCPTLMAKVGDKVVVTFSEPQKNWWI